MNTGQMLLVTGAIAMLTTLTASIANMHVTSDRIHDEVHIGRLAVSTCQDRLETLTATAFDSLATGNSIDTIFTPVAIFTCSTHVGYIYDTNPENLVLEPTSLKRISVWMTSVHLPGQVVLKSVVGED